MKQISIYGWDYDVLNKISDVTDTPISEVLDDILDEWLDSIDDATKEMYGIN